MNTLYLDLNSGISGDMFLGALLDLGLDFHALEAGVNQLGIEGCHLHLSPAERGHIHGLQFEVHLEPAPENRQPEAAPAPEPAHHHVHPHAPHSHGPTQPHSPHPHRSLGEIRSLIQASPLSDWIKTKAVAVFERLAVAEGKIHGRPIEAVCFHEVGALDSLVDIVGGCIALDLLGRPRVLASPVVDGTGWVDCAHGQLPLPVPAVLAVLGARGIPVTQCAEPNELVTPTGAALLAEFVEGFGPMRGLVGSRIGYGIGQRHTQTRPNVLRVVLDTTGGGAGVAAGPALDWEADTVAVLETNLDDVSAEVLGHFLQSALVAGALDVFHTPVQMKKNRPGVLLTLLCAENEADRFTELMLRETSAFGVRRHFAERRKLRREWVSLPTEYGEVVVKVGRLNGVVVQAAPEFEVCKRLAAQAGVPLKQVFAAAGRASPPAESHAHSGTP